MNCIKYTGQKKSLFKKKVGNSQPRVQTLFRWSFGHLFQIFRLFHLFWTTNELNVSETFCLLKIQDHNKCVLFENSETNAPELQTFDKTWKKSCVVFVLICAFCNNFRYATCCKCRQNLIMLRGKKFLVCECQMRQANDSLRDGVLFFALCRIYALHQTGTLTETVSVSEVRQFVKRSLWLRKLHIKCLDNCGV